MSHDRDMIKKSQPHSPEEEAEAIEAMRKRAEGEMPPATPDEAAEIAEAEQKLLDEFKPHPITTPIYKPPAE